MILKIISSTFIFTTLFWHRGHASKCVSNETRVPPSFRMEPADHYKFLESALQIYTDLRVPCDGLLTEWRFIAGNPFIYALHLGVFRKRHSTSLVFDLVAETHLSAMSTPDGLSGIWVYYPPEEPIEVKEGDYLGVFYDKYAISMEMLTIMNKNEINFGKAEQAKAYILLMDNLSLRQNKTIDVSKAAVAYRRPALSAVISPFRRVGFSPPPAKEVQMTTEKTSTKTEKSSTTQPSSSYMPVRPQSKEKTTFDQQSVMRKAINYFLNKRLTTTMSTPTTEKSTTNADTTEEIICNGFLCWPSLDYL